MKSAPKPPVKKASAALRPPARRTEVPEPAHDDEHVNAKPANEPQPTPVDTRAIAPLWDLPEQNIRIPQDQLQQTFVYRYILNEQGQHQRAHVGTLAADATGSTIRRQWGGGRFYLQARIGSRIVASRELLIDGPEQQSNLPFGPIGELNSGLITLTGGDPNTAALFAMFQMWMASQRTDFQTILTMQQGVLEKLATQFGASMIVAHLKEQLATANSRVRMLEEDKDKSNEREREYERESLKRKYKGSDTSWVDVVEAVGEIAPAVLKALPPKVQALLEGLVSDAGKSLPGGANNPGLPAGVTDNTG